MHKVIICREVDQWSFLKGEPVDGVKVREFATLEEVMAYEQQLDGILNEFHGDFEARMGSENDIASETETEIVFRHTGREVFASPDLKAAARLAYEDGKLLAQPTSFSEEHPEWDTAFAVLTSLNKAPTP